ncbi:MAG: hypothetical protein IJ083_10530 [Clostridia bacterium]|nr:hypothetical protein [Clostridia bacterium]
MVHRMDAAKGSRVIVIGGSNVAFGLDVHLMEELLESQGMDVTVCPMGLYAAVGTSAMLSLAEGAIRPGDTVILALEPTRETLTSYFGAGAFLKCAESDPGLLLRLSQDQRGRAAGNLLPYLQEKAALVRSGHLPRDEGVYAKAAFDDSCSMVYPREGNTMALGHDPTEPIDLSGLAVAEDFADAVNAFIRRAQKAGARVYMTFSPMNRSAVRGEARDYFTLLRETFRCPVISSPVNYILDSGWFYDSNFHLNTPGAQLRTYLLARDVLAEWGSYAPLAFELPMMPEPIRQEIQESADTGNVIFGEMEGGAAYEITGLTEQGLRQETLRLPSSHSGKPVAAISPGALAGADRLTELHVPESIACLPEGLLEGCPAIRRLVLEHILAPCDIAPGSLDQLTDLQILVPLESYAWYQDGYGCEENPWQSVRHRIVAY